MVAEQDRGDRLGVFCFGVKGAAFAAFGEMVVLRAPFGATVDNGLNEGESTFNRLAVEPFISHIYKEEVAWRAPTCFPWIGLNWASDCSGHD